MRDCVLALALNKIYKPVVISVPKDCIHAVLALWSYFLLVSHRNQLTYRCAGAGHLRDDIHYYSKELEKFPDGDDEHRAYLMDMGVKALRLVWVPQ